MNALSGGRSEDINLRSADDVKGQNYELAVLGQQPIAGFRKDMVSHGPLPRPRLGGRTGP